MNRSITRILITLRNGGKLRGVRNHYHAELRREDGSLVCMVHEKTLRHLTMVEGYLVIIPAPPGMIDFALTTCGESVAASIRNRVTP